MDVIGFLRVSLGSSTAQLHDILGIRRACECSDKLATVLEVCTTKEQRSVVCFSGQKDSMQRIFINKCVPFMVGSVCRVKRFTTGSRNVANVSLMTKSLKRRCGSGWEKRRLLCCGFRRIGKAMGQVYQCWRRIIWEINVFSQVRISHVLRFISICDLFNNSPSYQ
jgi:hypothetical protein